MYTSNAHRAASAECLQFLGQLERVERAAVAHVRPSKVEHQTARSVVALPLAVHRHRGTIRGNLLDGNGSVCSSILTKPCMVRKSIKILLLKLSQWEVITFSDGERWSTYFKVKCVYLYTEKILYYLLKISYLSYIRPICWKLLIQKDHAYLLQKFRYVCVVSIIDILLSARDVFKVALTDVLKQNEQFQYGQKIALEFRSWRLAVFTPSADIH